MRPTLGSSDRRIAERHRAVAAINAGFFCPTEAPEGVDEAAVRRRLLDDFSIEIGAGLGPLAGRIWRVGLMGAGSTLPNVLLFLTTLERALGAAGYRTSSHRAAVTVAEAAATRWKAAR